MPQQTKIFRVFVSSTFTDMKEERRILQRDVFPKLEKFCEANGARFQGVDLRWGVNEESALNQKTIQICLNEIARCQKISPKPNFLILLGDKYGWQPVPEIIPQEEMDEILTAFPDDAKPLIEKWYRLDENAVPPEYVLQPRTGEVKEYKVWEPVEAEIREVLRTALKKLNFTSDKLVKYVASATHQEIIAGALSPPDGSEKPEEHVFVYARKIRGLPEDVSARGYIDLTNEIPDPWCRQQLEELKSELKGKFKDRYREYVADWIDNQVTFNEGALQTFGNDVYEYFEEIIKDQLAKVIDTDEVNNEVNLHTAFKVRATLHFRGRKEILGTINHYLADPGEKRILSLIGESGSGKSSVMAQAVKLNENDKGAVVFRFIGTTSRSSNIMLLLQSLCSQIARAFTVDPLSFAMEGNDKAWYEINSLSDIFRKCLALATAEKPVLVFLDSLDQLSDTDNARALYWLPKELPEHARIVVSSLPELEDKLQGTYMEYLPVLPEEEARQILDRWFESIGRNLTPDQHRLVIDSFNKVKLPIYLKLAFEKSKNWHSYDKQHSLKEDVKGIINDYFDDLEAEHNTDFVTHVTCYMLSGKYQGLAENEILEILAFDDEYWRSFLDATHPDHRQELIDLHLELEKREPRGYMKIPIAVWSRFFLDLEPYLTERDAEGVPIITFFHRQFNEVLRERYEI